MRDCSAQSSAVAIEAVGVGGSDRGRVVSLLSCRHRRGWPGALFHVKRMALLLSTSECFRRGRAGYLNCGHKWGGSSSGGSATSSRKNTARRHPPAAGPSRRPVVSAVRRSRPPRARSPWVGIVKKAIGGRAARPQAVRGSGLHRPATRERPGCRDRQDPDRLGRVGEKPSVRTARGVIPSEIVVASTADSRRSAAKTN